MAFALAGGCSRNLPPQAVPPRILFYAPVSDDTLRIGDDDIVEFLLHGQGSDEMEIDVMLNDELVSRQDSAAFHFDP